MINASLDHWKREVAKFHNALHAPLLGIDLESVSPPYLHILLGVVLKHHKLLEDSAHRLDMEIVSESDEVLTHFGKSVKQYEAQWYQYKELEEKLQFEEGCLVFSDTESEIEKH